MMAGPPVRLLSALPGLPKGYYKDAEKTEELWRGGWLHTGDVGYMDLEGYIQITDRLKDVIKTGGEWVSSLDLENAISLHTAVQEAAAIGIPDAKWGERPMLLVVLTPEFRNDGITPEVSKEPYEAIAPNRGKFPNMPYLIST